MFIDMQRFFYRHKEFAITCFRACYKNRIWSTVFYVLSRFLDQAPS